MAETICKPGGKGLIFPLLESEQHWDSGLRAILYSAALIYVFLGVNIVADKFMSAIEAITSVKLRVRSQVSGRLVTVKRWNETVANLTLLALGSSAPEILLSIMEIIRNDFRAGALGPSTIVGSAAFNLFVIVAVCMWSIPSPEIRTIEHYDVFIITAACSIIAYLWLVFIVQVSSPDVVTILEGSLTLAMFPILVIICYLTDIGCFRTERRALDLRLEGRVLEEAGSVPTRDFLHPHSLSQPVGKPSSLVFGAGVDLDAAGGPNPEGVLSFQEDSMEIQGDDHARTVHVRILRTGGTENTVRCKYRMEKLTAFPDFDFEADSGDLIFGPGVGHFDLEVTILPKRGWEADDSFQIILEDISGGATFNPHDDGGENSCILTVTIRKNRSSSRRSTSAKLLSLVDASINVSSVRHGSVAWKQDIIDSIFDYGVDDGEEATTMDKAIYIISVPWKFSCALLIPPADYADGKICFVMALVLIAGLTVVIIDFAELFGCVTAVPDSITAITFVALGTSMPDLFASKIAAVEQDTADASIVNVTGSNSVNVFLGIGIPWTMAAVYWHVTDPSGAFVVKGGDLGFSVVVFVIAAAIAFAVLGARRFSFDGELGGPFAMKAISVTLFVLLWVFYILLSSWKVLNAKAELGAQIFAIIISLFVLQNVILVTIFLCKGVGRSSEGSGDEEFSALEQGVLKVSSKPTHQSLSKASIEEVSASRAKGVEARLFDSLDSVESSEFKSVFSEAVDLDDIDLDMHFIARSDALRSFRRAAFAIMAASRLQKAAPQKFTAAPPLPPPPYPPSDTMPLPLVVGTPVRMTLPVAAWTVLAAVKLRRGSRGGLDLNSHLVDSCFAYPTGAPVVYQPVPPAVVQATRTTPSNLAAVSTWFVRFLGRHVGDFLAVGACYAAASNLNGPRSLA